MKTYRIRYFEDDGSVYAIDFRSKKDLNDFARDLINFGFKKGDNTIVFPSALISIEQTKGLYAKD